MTFRKWETEYGIRIRRRQFCPQSEEHRLNGKRRPAMTHRQFAKLITSTESWCFAGNPYRNVNSSNSDA